jgi:hypothetical protein
MELISLYSSIWIILKIKIPVTGMPLNMSSSCAALLVSTSHIGSLRDFWRGHWRLPRTWWCMTLVLIPAPCFSNYNITDAYKLWHFHYLNSEMILGGSSLWTGWHDVIIYKVHAQELYHRVTEKNPHILSKFIILYQALFIAFLGFMKPWGWRSL